MSELTLPPDLEQQAAEIIASGRYRDVTELVRAGFDLVRQLEAERASLLTSLQSIEAEVDRQGALSLERVDQTMRQAIEAAQHRGA